MPPPLSIPPISSSVLSPPPPCLWLRVAVPPAAQPSPPGRVRRSLRHVRPSSPRTPYVKAACEGASPWMSVRRLCFPRPGGSRHNAPSPARQGDALSVAAASRRPRPHRVLPCRRAPPADFAHAEPHHFPEWN